MADKAGRPPNGCHRLTVRRSTAPAPVKLKTSPKATNALGPVRPSSGVTPTWPRELRKPTTSCRRHVRLQGSAWLRPRRPATILRVARFTSGRLGHFKRSGGGKNLMLIKPGGQSHAIQLGQKLPQSKKEVNVILAVKNGSYQQGKKFG